MNQADMISVSANDPNSVSKCFQSLFRNTVVVVIAICFSAFTGCDFFKNIDGQLDKYSGQLQLLIHQADAFLAFGGEIPKELDSLLTKHEQRISSEAKEILQGSYEKMQLLIEVIDLKTRAAIEQLREGLFASLVRIHCEGCNDDVTFERILQEISVRPIALNPRFATPDEIVVDLLKPTISPAVFEGFGFLRPPKSPPWRLEIKFSDSRPAKYLDDVSAFVMASSDYQLSLVFGSLLGDMKPGEYWLTLSCTDDSKSKAIAKVIVNEPVQITPKPKTITPKANFTLSPGHALQEPFDLKIFPDCGFRSANEFTHSWGALKYFQITYGSRKGSNADFWSSALVTITGRYVIDDNKLYCDVEFVAAEWANEPNNKNRGPRDDYTCGVASNRVLVYQPPDGEKLIGVVSDSHFGTSRHFVGDNSKGVLGGTGLMFSQIAVDAVGSHDSIPGYTKATFTFSPVLVRVVEQ